MIELRLDRAAAFLRGGLDGESDLAGIVELDVAVSTDGARIDWTLSNSAASAVPVRAVGWVVPLVAQGALRMFANGYQSWSPCGVVSLGVDHDPSTADDSFELLRAAHHSDQRETAGDELRSEQVAVIADSADALCVGWMGGATHEGGFRLRTGEHGPELVIEAHLGGAVLAGGSSRVLHSVRLTHGHPSDTPALLDAWAAEVGAAEQARVSAPYQVGWCSWYHYFAEINQESLLGNLALADAWPFDVFQLDDGYQRAIGDWLATNDKFSTDLDGIADAISAAGRRPGIWLAPFLAHPNSDVHRLHPEWIAQMPDGGGPIPGMINDIWDGVVDVVDTSNPEVLAHLEAVAAELVDAGFTYLKLDFTYAPSFDGVHHDPAMTPAERVRAGYDAIRRGAGDDAFILGCGAPLGSTVGVVDGMRIGPDVAPSWDVPPDNWAPARYRESAPSTRNAWQSTIARSFMHRRLWLNDPDCIMLRTDATQMSPAAVEGWARLVGASGGMALVSDDLALLGPDARALLDEVIETGRAVDGAARRGPAPACPDLLDHRAGTRLVSDAASFEGDPATGHASVRRTASGGGPPADGQ